MGATGGMTETQWGALRDLLDHTRRSNAFYQRHFSAAGCDWDAIESPDQFLQLVPFTTKQDLAEDQAANPPWGSNLSEPLAAYTRFCQTSGTKGAPLCLLDNEASWDWMLGNWQAVYDHADVSAGDRLYFAFSFGPFLGFWTAFEAAVKRGTLAIPGGGLSSVARLAAIQRRRRDG